MAIGSAAVQAVRKAFVLAEGGDGQQQEQRTAIAAVLATVLLPILLILLVIISTLSGSMMHNNTVVNLAFSDCELPNNLPTEYRVAIEKMRESFAQLDEAVLAINMLIEATSGGNSDANTDISTNIHTNTNTDTNTNTNTNPNPNSGLNTNPIIDPYRVKATFYALFFGDENLPMTEEDYRSFADCFVTYEQRYSATDGSSYTAAVAIPSHESEKIYHRIDSWIANTQRLERFITEDDKTNAQRIYVLAKYGQALPNNNLPAGQAMGNGSYAALINEAEKYLGYPYVWGGSTPQTSFDCSGFVCWVYSKAGVYPLSRTTATGIYNQCAVIPKSEAKPGDLIFFTKTYASAGVVSHVGIYVGNNQMLHCGDPIQYTSITTSYWQEHFYAFGRLPGI